MEVWALRVLGFYLPAWPIEENKTRRLGVFFKKKTCWQTGFISLEDIAPTIMGESGQVEAEYQLALGEKAARGQKRMCVKTYLDCP